MPKYVVLFNLNAEAAAGMMERPSDRLGAVRETFQGAGGDVEAFYWMLGQYDGLVIANLPDTHAMTAVSVAVAASGRFSHVETHELIEASAIGEILARAKELSYRAPGD
ncbi:MAG: hypothetical protein V7607_562 [Solirubrobacteraceae bacterium]|jgi:uncharacterized protein with GYD domain